MIKSVNTIDVYEINGTDTKYSSREVIEINSQWVRRGMVVINVGGVQYTVVAEALKKAIANSVNVH